MHIDRLFDHSPEEIRLQLERKISQAVEWENGRNIKVVPIKEVSLEAHFQSHWDVEDEYYRQAIKLWRGHGKVEVLTVIHSEPANQDTYIVDASDLVIGTPEDTFFFHMVETCWAVVIDITTPDNKTTRLAYHLAGIVGNKDTEIQKLLSLAREKIGLPTHISILYNSLLQNTPPEKVVQLPETPTHFIDLNTHDSWRAHDVYVTQDHADQYYNEAVPHSEDFAIARIKGGTSQL